MKTVASRIGIVLLLAVGAGCSGGGSGFSSGPGSLGVTPSTQGSPSAATPSSAPSPVSSLPPGASPTPTAAPTASAPPASSAIVVATGFSASVIANVGGARELAALPNGDLLVATAARIAIVQNAESTGVASTPTTFATVPDADSEGITFAPNGSVYVGSTNGVWQLGYTTGATTASSMTEIAHVRTGSLSATPDDQHTSTSVVATANTLFASVGSDCNACAEADPTRATIQEMTPSGAEMQTYVTRVRNAIALTIDPSTGHLWAGGADQDDQPVGHPYEWFDDVTAQSATPTVDYGWPVCYENHTIAPVPAGLPASSCNGVAIPQFVLPAYSTIIGATFYPANQTGAYVFPSAYRGSAFLAAHGSWHNNPDGTSAAQPFVAFVPMAGGHPAIPVNWADPTAQWQKFLSGFGTTSSNRIGRPTGIAVGSQGSLFIADDQTGNIYRVRPTSSAASSLRRK